MAAIAKRSGAAPSLASTLPPANEVISGLLAGEDIEGGDLCEIASNGLVMKHADGTPRGVAAVDASQGEAVTLYRNVRFGYGTGLTPGADVFASTTVDGGLDDDGGEDGVAIGFCVDAERIQFTGL